MNAAHSRRLLFFDRAIDIVQKSPVGILDRQAFLVDRALSRREQVVFVQTPCLAVAAPLLRARRRSHSQWSYKMQTNEEHVTMDGEEWELLERYEALFGETPPVAFLDPDTSKRMIKAALRKNRPFNEKDLDSKLDAL
jgi:hypothetical protein